MRYVLSAILLLAAPRGAFALTWEFDDGSTWGWTARAMTHMPSIWKAPTLHSTAKSSMGSGAWR